ncbi:MAG: YiiD C-terminal domain-containing protein [Parachlamydia sp.]|nr:YiiD C-terminal domain-containing protein [Parachlamydia sp.]
MKKQIEAYLHQHIPISKAMGIAVVEASLEHVVLSAPFASNINHKKTVFGGSLHAVATLACWCLLHIHLKEKSVQIVITASEVAYLAPVEADFEAECRLPEAHTWQRFLKTLKARGKARIQLTCQIHQNNRLAVDYRGTFAALKPDFG